ncbi:MAG: helix-turn-helix transcriptional regulator, partial [Herbaspirillum sp.]|uniref:helix-turn-helix domain-containing protein n=1 Tax=Herbaspirillum sp. TaxID=1890675 RepID=UPI0025825D22
MDHKKIKELAKKCGRSKTMIYCIIAGTRFPSRQFAELLEKETGVRFEVWMRPGRYINSWIEGVKK